MQYSANLSPCFPTLVFFCKIVIIVPLLLFLVFNHKSRIIIDLTTQCSVTLKTHLFFPWIYERLSFRHWSCFAPQVILWCLWLKWEEECGKFSINCINLMSSICPVSPLTVFILQTAKTVCLCPIMKAVSIAVNTKLYLFICLLAKPYRSCKDLFLYILTVLHYVFALKWQCKCFDSE